MKTDQGTPQTIDAYIAAFPPHVQAILEQIRMTIREAAPDAEETISYQMPTFMLHGQYLVYFAAYKIISGCILRRWVLRISRGNLGVWGRQGHVEIPAR